MNKKLPLWSVLLLLWFSGILGLLFGWSVWRVDNGGSIVNNKTSHIVIFMASFPTLVKQAFHEINQPSILVKPNRYPNIRGLVTERNYVDSNYLLLPFFDKISKQSMVKLLRLSDQKILYQWSPNFDELKNKLGNKNNYYTNTAKNNLMINHPLLSPDGSIVFDSSPSPLVKIDKASKLVWIVKGNFNHSLEFDNSGNIWTPNFISPSNFSNKSLTHLKDDAITEVSPQGKVLFKKSVAEILSQNGYRGLLLGTGRLETDLLHLNDVQPALTSTKYWKTNDLLISLRFKSTVFLYRPSTNKILWLQTGPWLNQHDVDFIDSTRIGVFGNDVIRTNTGEHLLNEYNEEYVFDFKTKKTTAPYTVFLKKAKVSTPSGGRSDILPNGDLFIEETDNNRLLRGTTKDIIWQYEESIDRNSVSALSWTRFLTKSEYKKLMFLNNK